MGARTGLEERPHLKIAGNIFLSYYLEAADELGIKYEMVIPSLMARFESGAKHWFIITTAVPINNVPSTTISRRKNLTYKVLKAAGIAVAEQVDLHNEEDAINLFHKKKDIVIKPVRNLGGNGVSILPKDEIEVAKAFTLAYEKSMTKTNVRALGETFINGTNYRVLVLDDKVLGVVKRIPAMITGDGISNIQKLIEIKNRERHAQVLKSIPVDDQLFKKLTSQGLDFQSVPLDGEEIFLRFNSNLSTGGTTEECSEELHPKFAQIAIDAVKAIGLKLGGVDLIAEDISNPNAECVVNEVNWNPGLRVHYMADKGEKVKVAIPIMKYIRENL